MKINAGTVLVLLFALLFTACKDQETTTNITVKSQPNFDLVGRWDMVKAYKGNKESKMLNKGYFTFDSLGNFATNILGDNRAFPFEQSGDVIKVNNPKKSTYNVISKTPDTLILSAKLRNFNFKFITSRSIK